MSNYIALYCDVPIAASNDKKLVKHYMEETRRLSSKDYRIHEGNTDQEYSTIWLTEYDGMYIPAVDAKIIEADINDIEMQDYGKSIVSSLKNLHTLTSSSKKMKRAAQKIESDIEYYNELLSSPDNQKRLLRQLRRRHPLYFCDIEAYLQTLRLYREVTDLQQEYFIRSKW